MANKRNKDVSVRRRKMQEKGLPWSYIIPVVILVIAIGGLVYYNAYMLKSPSGSLTPISVPTQTPQSIQDVPQYCDNPTPGACAYHWHVHLDIYVNSTSYVIVPPDLGHMSSGSLFAIHTHDDSGIIHLEVPNPAKNFTLAQIFEVWGYPSFNSTNCLTYYGQPVSVYVNGTLWTKTPIQDVPLTDHEEIAVVIGTSHPSIPSSYNFPAGL